jgi:hypothetical protein
MVGTGSLTSPLREEVTREDRPPGVNNANDVLMAIKERARRQKRGARNLPAEEDSEARKPESFYGFNPLPPRGRAVSNELIDQLRDGLG